MNLTSCEDTPVLSQCHLKQHFCTEPVSSAENARKPYRGHNRLNGCASFTTEVSHDPLLDIIDEYEPKMPNVAVNHILKRTKLRNVR